MIFFGQPYFVKNTVDDGYVRNESDAPSRIYAQYRNKPKAVAWYEITRSLATQLSDAAQAVRVMYDIDTAEGEQLNIIGRIVVIPRSYTGTVDLNPAMCAEWENNPAEFGDSTQMASALSVDQDAQMSDDLYRLVIKSKIIKNNSDASIESIIYGMNFLLPNAEVLRITDNEDMSFSIEFYGNISELERWALLNSTLIPKPQGVKFNGFLEGYGYVQSGDTSEEFGDPEAQAVGFIGV